MKIALRFALLLAVLGVALVWFERPSGEGAREDPVAPMNAVSKARESAAAELPEPATAPAQAGSREVLASEPAPNPPAPAEDASATMLHVTAVGFESHAPIAHVAVVARSEDEVTWSARGGEGSHARWGESTETDMQGRAELEVPPGVELRLHLIGDYSLESLAIAALEPGEQRSVRLELKTEEDLTLHGRLVDAETRAPIGEGVVWRDQHDATFSAVDALDTTSRGDEHSAEDEIRVRGDGTFQLLGHSWKTQFFNAKAPGYARVVFALDSGFGTPERPLEVRLSRSATLTVTVQDGALPVADAVVALTTSAFQLQQRDTFLHFYYTGQDPRWSSTTDAGGRAELVDLPPKVPLELSVQRSGSAPRKESKPLLFEPGERRSLEIHLGSGATILGRIEDSQGRPVPGYEIWRISAEEPHAKLLETYEEPAARTKSDPEGRFRFDDVAIGSWCVGPAPNDSYESTKSADAIPPLAQVVQIPDGATQVDLVLRVDRGLYLEGTVLDPSGMPTGSTNVSAHDEKFGIYESDNADDTGHFMLGPLPAGRYSVEASSYRGGHADSEPVLVSAGESGIVLRLRTGGKIRGRVIDSSGELRPAELMVSRAGDEWSFMSTGTSDGTFELDGLLAGTYAIVAKTTDGQWARRSGLAVGQGAELEGIDLRLELGARLRVKYEGKEEYGHCELRSQGIVCGGDGIQRGTTSDFVVPSGNIVIHWFNQGLQSFETQTVTLAPGEERELVWKGKP